MLGKLKNDYGFNPQILSLKFNRGSAKVIKKVFPHF